MLTEFDQAKIDLNQAYDDLKACENNAGSREWDATKAKVQLAGVRSGRDARDCERVQIDAEISKLKSRLAVLDLARAEDAEAIEVAEANANAARVAADAAHDLVEKAKARVIECKDRCQATSLAGARVRLGS